ncbi:MAG TPA: hypothetical protein DCS12_10850 [Clostridiales bacterium]|nr:hypothetical protein [Clostridiales bacterium]
MKVCFYARAGQTKLFAKMGLYLISKEIDCFFVCQDLSEEKKVKLLYQDAKTYVLTEFLRKNWDEFDIECLAELQHTYPHVNLWEAFYTDRVLINYSYEEAIKFLIGHIRFYEMVFNIEKPQVFYNEAIALFSAYAAYLVGIKYDVRYTGFIVSRDLPFEKYFLHHDPYQTNDMMISLFQKGDFNEYEIHEAKEYIDSYRRGEVDRTHRQVYEVGYKFKSRYLRQIGFFIKELFDLRNYDRINYLYYRRNIKLRIDLIKTYIRAFRQKKYFEEPCEGEQYYFYPLHYQPEASTLVCAKKYEKQLFLIDQLAKSIPIDSLLYVKEHYVYLGHKPTQFYKSLKGYPNVRLINPLASTHELIKKSRAVITLTGTVGFESLALGIPVFVLGNVFYDFFPNVVKIQDVFNQKERFIEPEAIDEQNLVRFICAYRKSMINGCAHAKSSLFESDINAKIMAEALLADEASKHSSMIR